MLRRTGTLACVQGVECIRLGHRQECLCHHATGQSTRVSWPRENRSAHRTKRRSAEKVTGVSTSMLGCKLTRAVLHLQKVC
jgi:hypothetical protein